MVTRAQTSGELSVWVEGDIAAVHLGHMWSLVQILECHTNGTYYVQEILDKNSFNGIGRVDEEELCKPTEEEWAIYLTQKITK